MFFAQMFCYGSDLAAVGITGIQGCMGIVYVGNNRLYAVHIPPMSAQSNQKGADDFAAYVALHENALGQKGDLYLFVNGMNRTTAIDEARHVKELISPKNTLLFRIMKGLGEGSGGLAAQYSPSVLVTGVGELYYKHVPEEDYVAGVGGFFGGQYLGQSGGMDSSKVPSTKHPKDTWTAVTSANSSKLGIH